MQNPFSIDTPDIIGQYARGFQVGQMEQQAQKQAEAEQQARLANEQMQNDLYQLYNNPNAGSKEYSQFMLKYPSMAENVKKAWDVHGAEAQDSMLSELTQSYSALSQGRPDIVVGLLQQKKQAAINSGNDAEAGKYDALIMMGEKDPQALKISLGSQLMALKGGEFMDQLEARPYAGFTAEAGARKSMAEAKNAEIESMYAGQKAEYELQKSGADIANINSQIADRAARLGYDERKLKADMAKEMSARKDKLTELDADGKKLINESSLAAVTARNAAEKMNTLAAEMDKELSTSGTYATVGEFAKNTLWGRNNVSKLRQQYEGIVTPAALAAYKKVASGSTSDKDIETAMKGVPPDNASMEELASFLRGAAKIQKYTDTLETAKSDWVSDNGHLGKAKYDIVVGGIQVPAGTSFPDYEEMVIKDKFGNNKEGEQSQGNQQLPQGRSYLRYAQ